MPNPSSTHHDPALAIAVWRELQAQLASEPNAYLAPERFVLQRDAYLRLTDSDIEFDAPFAAYEHTEMTSDEALDFALAFFVHHFNLTIGPTTISVPYAVFGFNATTLLSLSAEQIQAARPAIIATNIITAVKLLLSGQIALGCSWRGDELMAAETFLIGFEPRPMPIAISGNFSLFKRSSFEYGVKQNRILKPTIKISEDFPLLPPLSGSKRLKRGRVVDSIYDLEPLNQKIYDTTADAKRGVRGLLHRLMRTKTTSLAP